MPWLVGRNDVLTHSAVAYVCMPTLTLGNVWLSGTWLLDVNLVARNTGLEDEPRDAEQEPGQEPAESSQHSSGWEDLRPPSTEKPSTPRPNLGLNYHTGQGSRLPSHTRILWFAILPTASVLSFNSEKAFQQGHKGHRDDLKLWGRQSFPFPDLTSATQFEVPFLPLSLKEEKLLNSPGLRVVKNLITSSLLSSLRMHL